MSLCTQLILISLLHVKILIRQAMQIQKMECFLFEIHIGPILIYDCFRTKTFKIIQENIRIFFELSWSNAGCGTLILILETRRRVLIYRIVLKIP